MTDSVYELYNLRIEICVWLHAVYVRTAVGRGDAQKAGAWIKSSGVSSGEFGEQRRPCGLPGIDADTSICVSSFSRRPLGCVSQVERLQTARSRSEVCDQWCLYCHPLPCVFHLRSCSSHSGWPSPCGCWCLDTVAVLSCWWICFAVRDEWDP